MIQILNKEDCCGCSACVQICPKQCISLVEDNEGFLYPIVDNLNCINCSLCKKVCPVIHQSVSGKPLKVYAAINKNEDVRLQSSSGGVFTLLAEKTLKEGGVVFGARFDDNWEVKHDYTETIEGVAAFRGSKYVQSRIENNFRKAETFLKVGRKVLFSGTPCQIAGLKRYLRKDYDNLLTVDFICHGVPSPGVWRKYLKETIVRQSDKNSLTSGFISIENVNVKNISFRDKSLGWKNYSFILTISSRKQSKISKTVTLREKFSKNIFMKGFMADLYLRPSCYSCPAKSGKSKSDITIADYWGINTINRAFDDDKGISAIILNSTKYEHYLADSNLNMFETTYEDLVERNSAVCKSASIPLNRDYFFQNSESSIYKIINKLCKKSVFKRILNKIVRIVKSIIK